MATEEICICFLANLILALPFKIFYCALQVNLWFAWAILARRQSCTSLCFLRYMLLGQSLSTPQIRAAICFLANLILALPFKIFYCALQVNVWFAFGLWIHAAWAILARRQFMLLEIHAPWAIIINATDTCCHFLQATHLKLQ